MTARWARRCAALLAAAAVAGPLASCSTPAPEGFVQREGSGFVLDGEPFRFVGVNLYDAAASDRYSCRPESRIDPEDLEEHFRWLHDEAGVTVVRFWAYQTYTDSGRDFSAVDGVVEAARATGIRLIPVLEDGPGDCSTGEAGVPLSSADDGQWFSRGYREPYGSARLSMRDYAATIAAHYRDEPAVLAWMLVNEAETDERDDQGRSQLVSFAGDVGAVVQEADPNHLVTLGTQGNGAPGTSGPDFRAIYNQTAVDFAEVHDWSRSSTGSGTDAGSDEEAMPGGDAQGRPPAADSAECASTSAPVGCSFAIAAEIGTPVVVGEAGVRADDAEGRQRRAELLQDKAEAAFAAGAAGYLPWHYGTADTDDYDLLRSRRDDGGDPDPVFAVLARLAEDL